MGLEYFLHFIFLPTATNIYDCNQNLWREWEITLWTAHISKRKNRKYRYFKIDIILAGYTIFDLLTLKHSNSGKATVDSLLLLLLLLLTLYVWVLFLLASHCANLLHLYHYLFDTVLVKVAYRSRRDVASKYYLNKFSVIELDIYVELMLYSNHCIKMRFAQIGRIKLWRSHCCELILLKQFFV